MFIILILKKFLHKYKLGFINVQKTRWRNGYPPAVPDLQSRRPIKGFVILFASAGLLQQRINGNDVVQARQKLPKAK